MKVAINSEELISSIANTKSTILPHVRQKHSSKIYINVHTIGATDLDLVVAMDIGSGAPSRIAH
jgi:hypothetical protein